MAKSNKKIIGVIPARYASSRFPGKVLADIHGKPMIWWIYKNAKKSKFLSKILVATDDDRIAKVCANLNIPYVMTSTIHQTGTDRIGEVACKIAGDLYVNIQGDEPLIDASVIDRVIRPLIADHSVSVSNIMTKIINHADLINTNIVKVVVNSKNDAVFFSRSPIPFPKKTNPSQYYRQAGIYCFRPKILKQFCSSPRGVIEAIEEIEFLRFIENRIPIKMVLVESDSVGVDTPSDLELVCKIMKSKLKNSKSTLCT